jgi:hypothetical protein
VGFVDSPPAGRAGTRKGKNRFFNVEFGGIGEERGGQPKRLAVFNRNGFRALAIVTDIRAPVSARAILHDEMNAHPRTALRAGKTYQPRAEDRFYFRHVRISRIPTRGLAGIWRAVSARHLHLITVAAAATSRPKTNA